MAYDAFISYRRSDRGTADGVAKFLDAFGLSVFVDRGSRAGTEWQPELLTALTEAKVLVVLWSRSAAESRWVEVEWHHVSPACRIVPLCLDGAPLPEELRGLTAIEGLDVATRLLQRSVELMSKSRLSPSAAQAQLLRELEEDGIVLEPQQRRALVLFFGLLGGVFVASLFTRLGRWAEGALPGLAAGSIAAAALFGGGYVLGSKQAPASPHTAAVATLPPPTPSAAAQPEPAPSRQPALAGAATAPAPCPTCNCGASKPDATPASNGLASDLAGCVGAKKTLESDLQTTTEALTATRNSLTACQRSKPTGATQPTAKPLLLRTTIARPVAAAAAATPAPIP